jgi:hypothetical protein
MKFKTSYIKGSSLQAKYGVKRVGKGGRRRIIKSKFVGEGGRGGIIKSKLRIKI